MMNHTFSPLFEKHYRYLCVLGVFHILTAHDFVVKDNAVESPGSVLSPPISASLEKKEMLQNLINKK